ncbi:MAG: hypothetical protein ACRC8S_19840 [Fimbriiglobus sp.]
MNTQYHVFWDELIDTIEAFGLLKDDWDCLGSLAVNPAILSTTLSFLSEIRSSGNPTPNSADVQADGSILIEWQMPNGDRVLAEVNQPGLVEIQTIGIDYSSNVTQLSVPTENSTSSISHDGYSSDFTEQEYRIAS